MKLQGEGDGLGQRVGYRWVAPPGEKSASQLAGERFDVVLEDHTRDRDTRRPKLEAMLGQLRAGDTLVCESMEYLGRTLGELRSIVTGLVARGAGVEFLTQGISFSAGDDAISRLKMKMLGAFADFETAVTSGRRRTGIARAKAEGKYKGRKAKLSAERAEALRTRAAAGESKTALAREFGVSRETLYAYLRRGVS